LTHPELAGRLRQGKACNLKDGRLEVSFSTLFSKQMEFIDEETNRQTIERCLEDFYESPLRLSLLIQTSQTVANAQQEPFVTDSKLKDQYINDPIAQIVQKVFNVTIRNVLNDAPVAPPYHLGMSCNFKED